MAAHKLIALKRKLEAWEKNYGRLIIECQILTTQLWKHLDSRCALFTSDDSVGVGVYLQSSKTGFKYIFTVIDYDDIFMDEDGEALSLKVEISKEYQDDEVVVHLIKSNLTSLLTHLAKHDKNSVEIVFV